MLQTSVYKDFCGGEVFTMDTGKKGGLQFSQDCQG